MARDDGHRSTAGMVLRPTGAAAVVVRDDGEVVPVTVTRGDATDPGPVFSAIAATSPDPVDAVTVDVSDVLLDAVVHDHPEVPRMAVVRIVPRPAVEPALTRSPAELIERLVASRFTVAGGHDLLGRELRPLDRDDVRRLCDALRRDGTRHVAVVAAGSQARPQHERAVADAVQAAVPGCSIAVASEFGGQGLVAREASSVLDGALRPLAAALLARCSAALERHLPGTALRVARGDGGHAAPARAEVLPVTVLGATDALELRGAAHLAGCTDARIVLHRPDGPVAGEVRRGQAVVRTAQLVRIGTEVVVPTAVLAPHTAVGEPPDGTVVAHDEPALLAGVGAATSRPTSWLDEVAVIESEHELERVRRDSEERAVAFATANGAAPGSARVVELSIVAVPYSPAGTVRVRIRVAGDPDTATVRVAS
ncbi:hydantoinase/oxoprolinase N-terminal domain-containing protein [Jatrophihabitans sp. YIM 134969]